VTERVDQIEAPRVKGEYRERDCVTRSEDDLIEAHEKGERIRENSACFRILPFLVQPEIFIEVEICDEEKNNYPDGNLVYARLYGKERTNAEETADKTNRAK